MKYLDHEGNSLLKILEELGIGHETRVPHIDEVLLKKAQGDKEVLNLLNDFVKEQGDCSLPSECTSLMDRLSFTSRPILVEERSRAWDEFLEKEGVSVDPLANWAIARWYQDRGQLNHAAAMYERLDAVLRNNDCGLGYDYVLDMMDAFGKLGEYGRVRDLFSDVRKFFANGELDADGFRRAKQILAESVSETNEEVSGLEFRETIALLEAELKDSIEDLANTRFELARLRVGVNVQEERMAAEEWIDTRASGLKGKLCAPAWDTLVDALVILKAPSLKSVFYWCLPVACQKAVEAEFNNKIWKLVRSKLGDGKLGHYRFDLSINKLYDILANRSKGHKDDYNLEAMRSEIQRLVKDAVSPTAVQKLKVLKTHGTDARHGSLGGKLYTRERLIHFLQEVELDKANGWIFQWLGILSHVALDRRNAGGIC